MYYPKLSEDMVWAIDVIRQNLTQNPNYLDHPDCPWGDDDVIKLKKAFTEKVVREAPELEGGSKWEQLEAQTRRLYDDLVETRETLSSEDAAEKMSYFRTATSLLDKLIGLQERAANLRAISEYQNVVVGIFDDLFDDDTRKIAMDRLKEFNK